MSSLRAGARLALALGLAGALLGGCMSEEVREDNEAELAKRRGTLRAEFHFQQALSLHVAEKPDEEIAQLKKALKADPDHRDALLLLGTRLVEAERYEEAAGVFDRGMRQHQSDAAFPFELGRVLEHMGNVTQARFAYWQALRRTPKRPRHFLTLGGLEESAGRLDEARRVYLHGLKLFPDNAELKEARERTEDEGPRVQPPPPRPSGPPTVEVDGWVEKADWHLDRGEVAQAKALYARAVRERPKAGTLLLALGVCHMEERDWKTAISLLTRAVSAAPDLIEARACLGVAQLEAGRPLASVRNLEKALQLRGEDRSAALEILAGRALVAAANPKEAVVHFDRAFALDSRPEVAAEGAAAAQRYDGEAALARWKEVYLMTADEPEDFQALRARAEEQIRALGGIVPQED